MGIQIHHFMQSVPINMGIQIHHFIQSVPINMGIKRQLKIPNRFPLFDRNKIVSK